MLTELREGNKKKDQAADTFSVINIKVDAPPEFWKRPVEKLQEKDAEKDRFAELDDDHPDDEERGILVWFDQYPPEAPEKKPTAETEHIPQTKIGFIEMPEFCASPLFFVYTKIKRFFGWGFTKNYVTFYMSESDRRRGKIFSRRLLRHLQALSFFCTSY